AERQAGDADVRAEPRRDGHSTWLDRGGDLAQSCAGPDRRDTFGRNGRGPHRADIDEQPIGCRAARETMAAAPECEGNSRCAGKEERAPDVGRILAGRNARGPPPPSAGFSQAAIPCGRTCAKRTIRKRKVDSYSAPPSTRSRPSNEAWSSARAVAESILAVSAFRDVAARRKRTRSGGRYPVPPNSDRNDGE